MKKILTAILVIAMIASIASVAAFADYSPVKLSVADATVEEGEATAEVIVSISGVPTDLGLAAASFSVAVEGTTINDIKNIPAGTATVSDGTKGGTEGSFVWANLDGYVVDGAFAADFDYAKVIIDIPADAAEGDTYKVTIAASDDPDNYLAVKEDDSGMAPGYGAEVVKATATVTVVKAEVKDTTTVPDTTTDTDDKKPADDDKKPADDGNKPADDGNKPADDGNKPADDTTTKAPAADDGNKAPQTGDAAIVVIAAMIVALGTAIVVKKVNVK